MNRIRLISLIVLVMACASHAQQKIQITKQLAPGKYMLVQQMEMVTTTTTSAAADPITQPVTMLMEMHMDVQKPDETGNYKMICRFTRIKQDIANLLHYDSASPAQENEGNPLAILGSMLNTDLEITMSKEGKVLDVTGMDKIWDKMGQNPALKPMMDQFKSSMGDGMVKNLFTQSDMVLPTGEVAVGDTWEVAETITVPIVGELAAKFNCKLASFDPASNLAVIDHEGTMASMEAQSQPMIMGAPVRLGKMNMVQKGTTKVDIHTGLSTTALEQEMDMEMFVDTGGGEQRADIRQKSTISMTISPRE
jgi:hypothetical protein